MQTFVIANSRLSGSSDRTLGPLVLRGLAKIGDEKPIFDWGS